VGTDKIDEKATCVRKARKGREGGENQTTPNSTIKGRWGQPRQLADEREKRKDTRNMSFGMADKRKNTLVKKNGKAGKLKRKRRRRCLFLLGEGANTRERGRETQKKKGRRYSWRWGTLKFNGEARNCILTRRKTWG